MLPNDQILLKRRVAWLAESGNRGSVKNQVLDDIRNNPGRR